MLPSCGTCRGGSGRSTHLCQYPQIYLHGHKFQFRQHADDGARIPFDCAESLDLASPHGWDMPGLVRFIMIMGPLSSLFDIVTFGALIAFFHVDVPTFRTAWVIEAMATQILVVFVIRTSALLARAIIDQRSHDRAFLCEPLSLIAQYRVIRPVSLCVDSRTALARAIG